MNWKEQLLTKLLEDQVPAKKPKTPLSVKVAKGVLGAAGVASLIGGGVAVHKLRKISTAIPEFGRALQKASGEGMRLPLPEKDK